jgi:hypothetical protein
VGDDDDDDAGGESLSEYLILGWCFRVFTPFSLFLGSPFSQSVHDSLSVACTNISSIP